ncbi:hypothetical protein BHE74_00009469 [Ensete ventricosum]|nr:hypothetical protein BHE74_00009469 [Ensete ventricosum]
MCHTVTSLFHDLGVNATIHELDKDPRGREMERALTKLVGRNPPVPVVFIGGKLVGSTDRIMSLHLGGKLVPLLREAGHQNRTFRESSCSCKHSALVSREFKPYFFLNIREVDGQFLRDPTLVRPSDIDYCNLVAQVFPPALSTPGSGEQAPPPWRRASIGWKAEEMRASGRCRSFYNEYCRLFVPDNLTTFMAYHIIVPFHHAYRPCRAYPTEQELGNLNSAGVDSTEQELGNLGFCRGGGLGRESWDLVERVNSGTNPGDLAERVNSSTNPGDLTERVNSGTNPRDLAERVNSGTNPTDLAKRVNSGTNHGDLAERVNSGTNPGDLTERVDSGALALIL